MIENLFWIGFVGAALALGFAAFQARKVLKAPQGSGEVQKIALTIRQGTYVYLKRHYLTALVLFLLVFLLLLGLSHAGMLDDPYIPYAFLSGGLLSALGGLAGILIALSSHSRTLHAVNEGVEKGLDMAFSAGTVMGFAAAGLGLLDLSVWFHILKYRAGYDPVGIAQTMLLFGLGASLMSLFLRVGGGVFAKAAELGVSLLGQAEDSIPEGDPRNPAVIAGYVGAAAGDVAGMGADLYGSYVGVIPAAFALGAWAYAAEGMSWRAMLLPLAVAVVGVICSVLGSLLIRADAHADQRALLRVLRKGTFSAAALTALVMAPVTYLLLGSLWVCLALLAGLLAGCAVGYCTQRFTWGGYKPVRRLSASVATGGLTTVIDGLSLGMRSASVPILILVSAVAAAFVSAGQTFYGLDFSKGLYGIAVAAVGMLSSLGIVLSANAYAPVAGSAQGIARMAGLEEGIRGRTDTLDALGDAAVAAGKGFATLSSAFTALVLLISYVNTTEAKAASISLSLTSPALVAGIFAGAMLALLFAAFTLSAVQKTARSVASEVRRQLKEIHGILSGKNEPNYAACVDRCAKWTLLRMAGPFLLAVLAPLGVGLLLGPEAVVGLLAGVTVTGFTLAALLSNTGSAWDAAGRYLERDVRSGADQHGAFRAGGAVGGPLKDAAAPALNVLIKLCAAVSLLFSTLILSYNLIAPLR